MPKIENFRGRKLFARLLPAVSLKNHKTSGHSTVHPQADVFVVPPAIIAGVVGVATWNIRSVIISFRVAFFAWPILSI
jgi:hypothetical protein